MRKKWCKILMYRVLAGKTAARSYDIIRMG